MSHEFVRDKRSTINCFGTNYLEKYGIVVDLRTNKVFSPYGLLCLKKEFRSPTCLLLKYFEDKETKQIKYLLQKYPKVVAKKLGRTNLISHEIKFEKLDRQFNQGAYRVSSAKFKVIRKLLGLGIIR